MSEALEVEVKKLVPVVLPIAVVSWLERRAKELEKKYKAKVGIGTVARAIIEQAYKERKEISVSKSASTPAPGKELRPEKAEESDSEIESMNEETIKRDILRFPESITRKAFIKILRARGYDEDKAKRAINLLIVNGIYREEGNMLVLNKEGK